MISWTEDTRVWVIRERFLGKKYLVMLDSANEPDRGRLRYAFWRVGADRWDSPLFSGVDLGQPPCRATGYPILGDAISLCVFLGLAEGDTGADYFDGYTERQTAWTESTECEYLSCALALHEDSGNEGGPALAIGEIDLDREGRRFSLLEATYLWEGDEGDLHPTELSADDRLAGMTWSIREVADQACKYGIDMPTCYPCPEVGASWFWLYAQHSDVCPVTGEFTEWTLHGPGLLLGIVGILSGAFQS